MKATLSTLLAVLLLLCCGAALAEGTVYEAEAALLEGANRVVTDAKCSGWKAVGNFEGDADRLTFTVTVEADGYYDLTFTAKGIGGNKINNVLVDGRQEGTFECGSVNYQDATLKSVKLSAGEHAVCVSKSWGWITVDKLTVTPAQAIGDEVYEVGAELINPNATAEARALFAFLRENYGRKTLSGQVCDGGLAGAEIKAIEAVTGKRPAMLGLDMMDYSPARQKLGARSTAVEKAIAWHREGGVVTFCWHWNAPTDTLYEGKDPDTNSPRWWGGFYTRNTSLDLAAVMSGADPAGKAALDADIAAIAVQLKRLQEAGVPVLWRPLHEASGGWFWWGAQGPEACKQLWIYLYDQLTNVYGCNNLIWVWNGQHPDWYPGDEYVDAIGVDIYADQHNYSPQNAKFAELLTYSGTRKIIALTENGVVIDADQAAEANAHWAWFCTWSGDFVQRGGAYSEAYTEAELLRRVYDSEHVITLDEMPDLY